MSDLTGMKRVVVTGMGAITSIGQDWKTVRTSLEAHRTGVCYMADWERFANLNTRLAAPVPDFIPPKHYSRKQIRSMGRVALLATRASELALQDAGLIDSELLHSGQMGVAFGSSTGSTSAIADFHAMLIGHDTSNINANTYIKMMPHTTAVNVGVFFGLRGRILTTSSACTSGSQGIGYAFEAIRFGRQTAMIAGGAEELCPTEAAVFDTLFATSTRNSTPQAVPRPFDRDRDGLVIGEGSAALILEEYAHARARGAHIHAEIIGYATNSDGKHVTQPDWEQMRNAMLESMRDAGINADRIGYVSAHGTATDRGDIAESRATQDAIGTNVPISSLKSYLGHTLGACGAIEAWATLHMMRDGWFHPTANLDNVDPACAPLDYIVGNGRELNTDVVMSNNFAFGGINTSLIFRRV
jgi:3-oxoacyl-[acyl-carrier-protein] synthase II